MGKLLVVAVVMLAACQPMYGKKAQRLATPTAHPPKGPAGQPGEGPLDPPPYDEACTVDWSAPPTTKRQTKVADAHVATGDVELSSATASKTPIERQQHAATSVKHYRDALVADPYNPEATLKLALAYDSALRKGCAIAMLKRLEKLGENPKFKAEGAVARVVDNEQWFKPYRQDALRAVGH